MSTHNKAACIDNSLYNKAACIDNGLYDWGWIYVMQSVAEMVVSYLLPVRLHCHAIIGVVLLEGA